jgi:uncharacterized protein (TIGR02145 family)
MFRVHHLTQKEDSMSIFKTVLKGILLCAALSLTGCNNGNDNPSTAGAGGGENPVVGGGNGGDSCVVIGNQCWMKKNLNVPHNAGNGDSWCYEGEDSSTGSAVAVTAEEGCAKYGRLYDWAAAMNLPSDCNSGSCADQIQAEHQGLCPEGFHIPTDAEWTALINVVENTYGYGAYGNGTAASHLKARDGWESCGDSGFLSCEDSYGFSALPAGWRSTDGVFGSAGIATNLWSATESNSAKAYNRLIVHAATFVTKPNNEKSRGYSVRCVKVNDRDKPLVEIDNTKCGNDPVDLPNTSGDVTGLVFGDGHRLSNQAWVKDNGNGTCEGYAIYNQLPFGADNRWAEVNYDRKRGCWYASEIASCGWRVDGDTLRIGYSAMAEHGVVWGWDFEGTYKVSGNELTLTAPGKAPVVYTKRELSPSCYEVEGY